MRFVDSSRECRGERGRVVPLVSLVATFDVEFEIIVDRDPDRDMVYFCEVLLLRKLIEPAFIGHIVDRAAASEVERIKQRLSPISHPSSVNSCRLVYGRTSPSTTCPLHLSCRCLS